jgi:hypothetical protein
MMVNPRVVIVQLAGRPKTAVLNVPRAARVRMGAVATIVHWDMLERETTWMQHNADNANWVKPQRSKGPPRAVGAI